MGRSGLKKIIFTGLIASCGITMLHQAHAQPPLQKVGIMGKLDLRPPLEIQMSKSSAASPPTSKLIWHSSTPEENSHIMSPMETLVHNFHQEGLPVAKLFQNNESLVHLGLNPKGKPGLWLIHKTH